MTRKTKLEVPTLLKRFGKAVKSARVAKGERQSDVNEAIGLSQNILTNLETGNGSTLASALAVLQHLGVYDDVIELIKGDDDSLKERVKPSKPKPSKALDISSMSDKEEIFKQLDPENDEIIELSDAIDDDNLFEALKSNPDRVFRINRTLALKLFKELDSSIAVYTRTVRYRTPGGAVRNREVYYATTIETASQIDLSWTVGGFLRKSNSAVDAVLSPDELGDLRGIVSERSSELLVVLRKEFSKYNVFIDSVSFGKSGITEKSYLRKGRREIRGQRYKDLFESTLSNWLDSIKEE
ncbi:hypothetical protein N7I40_004082 [Vibrio parahaemolyticus]|uniref:helix-turn-helix domain-containing protein n=1 Tax=Vibrio alginolyticus TaxID=663 RepID=UPI001BD68834|nr:hypothetical protein [Vibrio alginolyticus]EGR3221711.1 hypothetical protein [Vibrio parahaemolyticus]EHK6545824.1 hypothetical protein [Vibrio parahaemolyticus]EJL8716132.1 hypothetical protein [Vibrio alginolyticus]EJV5946455.1 hypothetical protein [Vibrio parahaemolyticus]EKN4564957.1 hypothetical protein [Vibrio parahaemolyticus]